ncbi:MAG TPA: LytR C-terminal domain-containing protein [Sphingomicrobium sp.]|nr:LytR C-terminal domain-containing protein [Sphingomicrobium sp.]
MKFTAIPDPSAVLSQGGDEIAVARGQMVLGNVGLALEGFRKAQRANPSNPAALAGIGDCYTVMGRFDLAQSNYEAALALAPHNQRLLLGLATIFDREGKPELAMAARAEAAIVPRTIAQSPSAVAASAPTQKVAIASAREPATALTARATGSVPVPAEKIVEIPRPSIGSVTVELPRARPVEHVQAQSATLAPTEIRIAQPTAAVLAAVPVPTSEQTAHARVVQAEIPRPSIGSVTVELPPARPVQQVQALAFAPPTIEIEAPITLAAIQSPLPAAPARPEQTADIPRPSLKSAMLDVPVPRRAERVEANAASLAATKIEAVPAEAEANPSNTAPRPALPRKPMPSENGLVAMALAPAPRLERLTSGEVALVTTDKPLWRSSTSIQTASAPTVRWVALASPSDRPNVQILNAARSQGLAASARTVLLDRGWRRIAVGDAPAMLHKSVVLYPKSRAALGHRLAAQFGVGAQLAERNNVVLVLGRDSVDRISGRRGS